MTQAPNDPDRSFDGLRAFCEQLKATGLESYRPRWGITDAAVLRDAGGPLRVIEGTDTDSRFAEHRRPDGSTVWKITLMSEDTPVEGIAYYSDHFLIASPVCVAEAKAIDAWLDAHPEAYELFVPIRWSAAPDEARKAKAWMDANRSLWEAGPLKAMYDDLYAELERAVT